MNFPQESQSSHGSLSTNTVPEAPPQQSRQAATHTQTNAGFVSCDTVSQNAHTPPKSASAAQGLQSRQRYQEEVPSKLTPPLEQQPGSFHLLIKAKGPSYAKPVQPARFSLDLQEAQENTAISASSSQRRHSFKPRTPFSLLPLRLGWKTPRTEAFVDESRRRSSEPSAPLPSRRRTLSRTSTRTSRSAPSARRASAGQILQRQRPFILPSTSQGQQLLSGVAATLSQLAHSPRASASISHNNNNNNEGVFATAQPPQPAQPSKAAATFPSSYAARRLSRRSTFAPRLEPIAEERSSQDEQRDTHDKQLCSSSQLPEEPLDEFIVYLQRLRDHRRASRTRAEDIEASLPTSRRTSKGSSDNLLGRVFCHSSPSSSASSSRASLASSVPEITVSTANLEDPRSREQAHAINASFSSHEDSLLSVTSSDTSARPRGSLHVDFPQQSKLATLGRRDSAFSVQSDNGINLSDSVFVFPSCSKVPQKKEQPESGRSSIADVLQSLDDQGLCENLISLLTTNTQRQFQPQSNLTVGYAQYAAMSDETSSTSSLGSRGSRTWHHADLAQVSDPQLIPARTMSAGEGTARMDDIATNISASNTASISDTAQRMRSENAHHPEFLVSANISSKPSVPSSSSPSDPLSKPTRMQLSTGSYASEDSSLFVRSDDSTTLLSCASHHAIGVEHTQQRADSRRLSATWADSFDKFRRVMGEVSDDDDTDDVDDSHNHDVSGALPRLSSSNGMGRPRRSFDEISSRFRARNSVSHDTLSRDKGSSDSDSDSRRPQRKYSACVRECPKGSTSAIRNRGSDSDWETLSDDTASDQELMDVTSGHSTRESESTPQQPAKQMLLRAPKASVLRMCYSSACATRTNVQSVRHIACYSPLCVHAAKAVRVAQKCQTSLSSGYQEQNDRESQVSARFGAAMIERIHQDIGFEHPAPSRFNGSLSPKTTFLFYGAKGFAPSEENERSRDSTTGSSKLNPKLKEAMTNARKEKEPPKKKKTSIMDGHKSQTGGSAKAPQTRAEREQGSFHRSKSRSGGLHLIVPGRPTRESAHIRRRSSSAVREALQQESSNLSSSSKTHSHAARPRASSLSLSHDDTVKEEFENKSSGSERDSAGSLHKLPSRASLEKLSEKMGQLLAGTTLFLGEPSRRAAKPSNSLSVPQDACSSQKRARSLTNLKRSSSKSLDLPPVYVKMNTSRRSSYDEPTSTHPTVSRASSSNGDGGSLKKSSPLAQQHCETKTTLSVPQNRQQHSSQSPETDKKKTLRRQRSNSNPASFAVPTIHTSNHGEEPRRGSSDLAAEKPSSLSSSSLNCADVDETAQLLQSDGEGPQAAPWMLGQLQPPNRSNSSSSLIRGRSRDTTGSLRQPQNARRSRDDGSRMSIEDILLADAARSTSPSRDEANTSPISTTSLDETIADFRPPVYSAFRQGSSTSLTSALASFFSPSAPFSSQPSPLGRGRSSSDILAQETSSHAKNTSNDSSLDVPGSRLAALERALSSSSQANAGFNPRSALQRPHTSYSFTRDMSSSDFGRSRSSTPRADKVSEKIAWIDDLHGKDRGVNISNLPMNGLRRFSALSRNMLRKLTGKKRDADLVSLSDEELSDCEEVDEEGVKPTNDSSVKACTQSKCTENELAAPAGDGPKTRRRSSRYQVRVHQAFRSLQEPGSTQSSSMRRASLLRRASKRASRFSMNTLQQEAEPAPSFFVEDVEDVLGPNHKGSALRKNATSGSLSGMRGSGTSFFAKDVKTSKHGSTTSMLGDAIADNEDGWGNELGSGQRRSSMTVTSYLKGPSKLLRWSMKNRTNPTMTQWFDEKHRFFREGVQTIQSAKERKASNASAMSAKSSGEGRRRSSLLSHVLWNRKRRDSEDTKKAEKKKEAEEDDEEEYSLRSINKELQQATHSFQTPSASANMLKRPATAVARVRYTFTDFADDKMDTFSSVLGSDVARSHSPALSTTSHHSSNAPSALDTWRANTAHRCDEDGTLLEVTPETFIERIDELEASQDVDVLTMQSQLEDITFAAMDLFQEQRMGDDEIGELFDLLDADGDGLVPIATMMDSMVASGLSWSEADLAFEGISVYIPSEKISPLEQYFEQSEAEPPVSPSKQGLSLSRQTQSSTSGLRSMLAKDFSGLTLHSSDQTSPLSSTTSLRAGLQGNAASTAGITNPEKDEDPYKTLARASNSMSKTPRHRRTADNKLVVKSQQRVLVHSIDEEYENAAKPDTGDAANRKGSASSTTSHTQSLRRFHLRLGYIDKVAFLILCDNIFTGDNPAFHNPDDVHEKAEEEGPRLGGEGPVQPRPSLRRSMPRRPFETGDFSLPRVIEEDTVSLGGNDSEASFFADEDGSLDRHKAKEHVRLARRSRWISQVQDTVSTSFLTYQPFAMRPGSAPRGVGTLAMSKSFTVPSSHHSNGTSSRPTSRRFTPQSPVFDEDPIPRQRHRMSSHIEEVEEDIDEVDPSLFEDNPFPEFTGSGSGLGADMDEFSDSDCSRSPSFSGIEELRKSSFGLGQDAPKGRAEKSSLGSRLSSARASAECIRGLRRQSSATNNDTGSNTGLMTLRNGHLPRSGSFRRSTSDGQQRSSFSRRDSNKGATNGDKRPSHHDILREAMQQRCSNSMLKNMSRKSSINLVPDGDAVNIEVYRETGDPAGVVRVEPDHEHGRIIIQPTRYQSGSHRSSRASATGLGSHHHTFAGDL